MTHIRTALLACLLLGSTTARADFLGIHMGVGFWSYDMTGEILGTVQLDQDLNIFEEQGVTAYAAFEHPVPLLPNIRVAYSDVKHRGNTSLSSNFSFRGESFTVGQTLDANFDLTHLDTTLYYEIVDIGFDLDFGATLRVFDGNVTLGPVKEDVVAYLPAIYGNVKVGLPLSGLYVGATANGASEFTDYEVKVGWEVENFILPEFGISVGYRKLAIDADAGDLDLRTEVDIDGAFITLTGHF